VWIAQEDIDLRRKPFNKRSFLELYDFYDPHAPHYQLLGGLPIHFAQRSQAARSVELVRHLQYHDKARELNIKSN
jgi:hypothetical protein